MERRTGPSHLAEQRRAATPSEAVADAARLRDLIARAEAVAQHEPDHIVRESAVEWLRSVTDPSTVPPFPPALAPRRTGP